MHHIIRRRRWIFDRKPYIIHKAKNENYTIITNYTIIHKNYLHLFCESVKR